MINQEMKNNKIHCRGQRLNCYNCKDANELTNKCKERGHRHDDGSYAPVIVADDPREGILRRCPICRDYI